MSKQLSNIERNRRKYKKMLNSLENKMLGSNLIWWKSLSLNAKYALLFRHIAFRQEPNYKFKYFIQKYKPLFIPKKVNYRNAIIEHLIEE